jgi:hypothetical protein
VLRSAPVAPLGESPRSPYSKARSPNPRLSYSYSPWQFACILL